MADIVSQWVSESLLILASSEHYDYNYYNDYNDYIDYNDYTQWLQWQDYNNYNHYRDSDSDWERFSDLVT